MHFKEEHFIRALTERREDTRRFSQMFRPEWLKTAVYRPILAEVYSFLKEYDTPPNIKVLHEIFEKKDKSQYDARFKAALDVLYTATPEISETLYALDQAKDVAVSRSLTDLVQGTGFGNMNKEFDGSGQIKAMQRWLRQFEGDSEDIELDIREAIEQLIAERGWGTPNVAIPCGVEVVDNWSGGGLRKKETGILLAPTGHGKSTFLMIIAHKMATIEDKNVLFISNELAMEAVTERFMSRITGERIDKIRNDPVIAYHGLERHWKSGLDNKLRLVEVAREITTDDIEAMVGRYINLYGWSPDAVVIDFMERMKPTVTGVKRDQSWNWLGYIAKDIVRCAKRNNWLVWTAGQTNRKGADPSSKITLGMAQGSYQHLQEADMVVAMRQQRGLELEDKEAVLLEFSPLKIRNAHNPGESVMVEARLGRMNITKKVRELSEWTNPEGDGDADKPDWMKKKGSGS